VLSFGAQPIDKAGAFHPLARARSGRYSSKFSWYLIDQKPLAIADSISKWIETKKVYKIDR